MDGLVDYSESGKVPAISLNFENTLNDLVGPKKKHLMGIIQRTFYTKIRKTRKFCLDAVQSLCYFFIAIIELA